MTVLVTGGSGSGKSAWAEKLADTLPRENRVYVATMQVYDEESRLRVKRHREQRADKGFVTVAVLVEDLVNLTANEMFGGGDVSRIVPALQSLSRRCRHLILVTGDLFSDGHAYSPSVQDYLRCLADVNRQAAEMADCVVEVVYSIPVALKGELPCV